MPLSDLPLSVFFLVFLAVFVVIGLYPAWQRLADRLRKRLKDLGETIDVLAGNAESATQASPAAAATTTRHLNDFELLVLWQLSQGDNKGLSRKQINGKLHLVPSVLNKTLQSLGSRGLVSVAITSWFGIRYFLSEKGRNYSIERGFIPIIHGTHKAS